MVKSASLQTTEEEKQSLPDGGAEGGALYLESLTLNGHIQTVGAVRKCR